MAKFRKKPVVVEATQWFKNGDHPEDGPGARIGASIEGKVVRYFRHPYTPGENICEQCNTDDSEVQMHLHGWIDQGANGITVCPGDWVVKNEFGEYWPVKPSVFEETYEPAKQKTTTTTMTEILQSPAVRDAMVEKSMDNPVLQAREPGPFDNMTRIELVKKCEAMMDGAETAWGIIANARNWNTDPRCESVWVVAAIRWRDEFYHPLLDSLPKPSEEVEPPAPMTWEESQKLIEKEFCGPTEFALGMRASDARHGGLKVPEEVPGYAILTRESYGTVVQCVSKFTHGIVEDDSGRQWRWNEEEVERPPMTSNAGPNVASGPLPDFSSIVDSGEMGRLFKESVLDRMPEHRGPRPPASGAWVPRWVALTLWWLLDDIDTYSDIFKDNYEGLAKAVYKKQRQRFQVGTSDGYEVTFNEYSEPPREEKAVEDICRRMWEMYKEG